MNNVTIAEKVDTLNLADVLAMDHGVIFKTTPTPGYSPEYSDVVMKTNTNEFISLKYGTLWLAKIDADSWLNHVTFEIVTEPVTITPQKK